MELNKTYNELNLKTMARMPDDFVDLVITSPPYGNARKTTYGGIHPDKYIDWFTPIAKEIYRVLNPSGSFILNIGDNTIDGETHLYTFEIPIVLKREIGFKFIDPLVWHKKAPPPGKFKNRFKDSWEFCYHFTKTFDIKFFPNAVSKPAKQISIERALREKEDAQQKSNTKSGFTRGALNMKRRIRSTGSNFGTIDERLDNIIMALPGNVLYLSGETTNVGHPAAFPIDIPIFFIKAFTEEGHIVYDPFMGSGTTAIAAHQMKRNWIGSELSENYCKGIEKRMMPYLAQHSLF